MSAKCYTVAQLLGPDLLNLPRATFYALKAAGKLPMLEELKPRMGRRARFRADLVDRYLANQWQPRSVAGQRRTA
jgi:excisionase family DNA binding protein